MRQSIFDSSCSQGDSQHVHPKSRQPHLDAYYSYPKESCEIRKERVGGAYQSAIHRVSIARVCDREADDDDIHIDYYQVARPGKFPAILISPILGGKDIVSKYFARTFVKNGLHCAIAHRERKPVTKANDIDEVELFFKNAIITIRYAVDWLTEQEEVDQERMGSFGISFGAIKNVIAAGVEPRLKCHLFALAGGSLADIVCYSQRKEIGRWRDRITRKHGMSVPQLHHALSDKVLSDPLPLGEYVDGRGVLMFIARFDKVVPRTCAEKLWQSLGKPEKVYFPFGHYSSALALPYARAKSLKFFKKCFGPG